MVHGLLCRAGTGSLSARGVGAVRVAEPVGALAEPCVGLGCARCCSSPFLDALKASWARNNSNGLTAFKGRI